MSDEQSLELFALVAHDLHSPVAALLLQLGSLRRLAEAESIDRAKLLKKVDKALLATERLGSLLEALLEVSRIERNIVSTEPTPVDLADVLAEVQPKLAGQARNAECAVELKLESAAGVWDRRRVEQIAALLLSHAIRIGHNGVIEVETATAEEAVVLRISVQSRRAKNSSPEQPVDALELSLALHLARSLSGEVTTFSADPRRVYEARLPR